MSKAKQVIQKIEEAVGNSNNPFKVGTFVKIDWDGPSKALITADLRGTYRLQRVGKDNMPLKGTENVIEVPSKELESEAIISE